MPHFIVTRSQSVVVEAENEEQASDIAQTVHDDEWEESDDQYDVTKCEVS